MTTKQHTMCCKDHDRTLCGQSIDVVGSGGKTTCGMCEVTFNMRPLPCPLGGECDRLTDKKRMPRLRLRPPDELRDLKPLPSGKLWWGKNGTPITDGFTDEELVDFVYERYEPFNNHKWGVHDCPCWRCTMLRNAGFYPEATFDPGNDTFYVNAIRTGSRREAAVCDECGCNPCECEDEDESDDVCCDCGCEECECRYDCGCDKGCECGDCWDCHADLNCDCEKCTERRKKYDDKYSGWSDKYIWHQIFLNESELTTTRRNRLLDNAGRTRDWPYDRVEASARGGSENEIDHRQNCVDSFRRGN